MFIRRVPDELSMLELGRSLCGAINPGALIYFSGNLGMGKTTLIRGILNGLGCHQSIPSPTYTLVETYETERFPVNHLDLYRLGSPEELETLGFRDMLDGWSACLVEWPERGKGFLPPPSARIDISASGTGRTVTVEYCTGEP